MKDPADTITADLLPGPKGRGRPKTGTAMTPAQRKAAQRARDRQKYGELYNAPNRVPLRIIAETLGREDGWIAFTAWLEIGERRGWISSEQRIALRDAKLGSACLSPYRPAGGIPPQVPPCGIIPLEVACARRTSSSSSGSA